MDFERLRAERQTLANATIHHAPSVLRFRPGGLAYFRLDLQEEAQDDGEAHHLSTTASCLESLSDVAGHQPGGDTAVSALAEVAASFARAALKRPPEKWKSEGAAEVYCRVRTLPGIISLADSSVLQEHGETILSHVNFVWSRLHAADPEAQGIAEATPLHVEAGGGDEGLADETRGNAEPSEPRRSYPPNAFHTYWALRLLRDYEGRGSLLPALPSELSEKAAVARLWAQGTMSAQTSLINSRKESFDAHQLAWALLADLLARPSKPVTPGSEEHQLYEAALAAFFSRQEESGRWPLYEPLFHYPEAGNAYCYTFETLAELLRPALKIHDGRLLRDLLEPHLDGLLRARTLAARTAVDTGRGTVGWSSGHHPHRRQPEAWATAAVFSFYQMLRRLTAYWTSEAANRGLAVRRPQWTDQERAAKTLRAFGETWATKAGWSVGRRLAGLFLNPHTAAPGGTGELDPDRPLVPEENARSAILFGPPGTGKTTLVEALAGALGWRYAEVHASNFLSEGMDRVPARADEIFAQLMELDRCVVLFDEVDELIRDRGPDRSDPFGRFLTTSMLPKLAQLWKQRRILFFVATNNISEADAAIRRSQRFDASIFAAPPSFSVKLDLLKEALGAVPDGLDVDAVNNALEEGKKMDTNPLGVFALVRHDQIAELADLTRQEAAGQGPSLSHLRDALKKIGEDLKELEWAPRQGEDPFDLWRRYDKLQRRDYRRLALGRVEGLPSAVPEDWHVVAEDGDHRYIAIRGAVDDAIVKHVNGAWTLTCGGWEAQDDGLLRFSPLAPDSS